MQQKQQQQSASSCRGSSSRRSFGGRRTNGSYHSLHSHCSTSEEEEDDRDDELARRRDWSQHRNRSKRATRVSTASSALLTTTHLDTTTAGTTFHRSKNRFLSRHAMMSSPHHDDEELSDAQHRQQHKPSSTDDHHRHFRSSSYSRNHPLVGYHARSKSSRRSKLQTTKHAGAHTHRHGDSVRRMSTSLGQFKRSSSGDNVDAVGGINKERSRERTTGGGEACYFEVTLTQPDGDHSTLLRSLTPGPAEGSCNIRSSRRQHDARRHSTGSTDGRVSVHSSQFHRRGRTSQRRKRSSSKRRSHSKEELNELNAMTTHIKSTAGLVEDWFGPT